jgi:hypothetical protein
MIRTISRYLVWAWLPLALSLSGCIFQKPAPDEVIAKFAQASSTLTTFQYSADLILAGRLPIAIVEGASNAVVKLTGSANNQDPNNPQFTLQASILGTASAGGFGINGDLVSVGDYTYFRMTNLSLPTLAPVTLGADSHWYKVHHVGVANPNENKLGVLEKTAFTTEQIEQLRKLLADTSLFEVTEILPDATVSGQRSYHYRTKLKAESITSLSQQISTLLNIPLTEQNLNNLSDYQPELWINKRTFQLSQFKLSGLYQTDGVPTDFDLTLGLSHQNEKLTITPPKESEELNPEQWLRQQL